jgi:hypothetical protein
MHPVIKESISIGGLLQTFIEREWTAISYKIIIQNGVAPINDRKQPILGITITGLGCAQ